MMFLLPAILVVVPMLSCAGPLGSLYYDYYDLMEQCLQYNIDGFFPHPTRCDLYIQCVNVQSPQWRSVYVQSCPAGLHWNRFAQHCDTPENACCNSTSHVNYTPPPPTTTTTRAYEPNVPCPGNGDRLYPHPTNCNQYIQCLHAQSSATVKTCQNGLLFNRLTQVCDWPQNVNCNSIGPISTTSTPAPTTTTDGETGLVDLPCPGGPKPGRYPDPDCRFYLHCTHTGTPDARVYRLACAGGLFFNPVTDRCDQPANVPSCGEVSTIRTEPTRQTRTTEATTVTTGGNGQTGYEVCYRWYPDTGLYPDPRNCSVYWVCVFRAGSDFPRAIRQECPRGQWFDRVLQCCNYTRDVHNCVNVAGPLPAIPNDEDMTPTYEYEASGNAEPVDGTRYLFDTPRPFY